MLVSNGGFKIKSGYLDMPVTTWKDTSTWKNGKYTISNFQGVPSGRLIVTLFLFFGIRGMDYYYAYKQFICNLFGNSKKKLNTNTVS